MDVPQTAPCWSNIVKKQAPPKQQEGVANHVFVESCKSSKGITVAIVDANAIIQGGEKLMNCADKFVTVSEVMEEVRDPISRHKLAMMPFSVESMEPSPEVLKKVVNFARATGDLQTLSGVDLKLIALTYTLEAQIHGTKHLRDSPPPVYIVNAKRLSENEMPGWGSNVPNLEEWEALEHAVETDSNSNSRVLPLKDLNLNEFPVGGNFSSEVPEIGSVSYTDDQNNVDLSFRKPRRFMPRKKEINIEGKKMVADGIDASQGQLDNNDGDWLPAVSRSTHRRYLRRKARRELSDASSEKGEDLDVEPNMEINSLQDAGCDDSLLCKSVDGAQAVHKILEEEGSMEVNIDHSDLPFKLKHMQLEANSSGLQQEEEELNLSGAALEVSNSVVVEAGSDKADIAVEGERVEMCDEELDHLDISSQVNESARTSILDDNSSEQSWTLQSLSDSSVACVTSDFAMQNVILQIGLRLLAPGGMQIRQLHRWILKCHACNKVTAEIGRIFCPKCGNGGTLRKVAVTVGNNGVVLADRRRRINLRGTKFSLSMPQGGRDAVTKNLILREDQLPHKLLYPKTKKKTNKQEDAIFTPDSIFCDTADKKSAFKPPVGRAIAVFSGKRNPNDNHFSRSKRH